ncbi:MAG TPA: hypothetical protein VGQ83_36220 [Polyangia bacterium]|jgi:hypothetical protein
MARKRKSRLLPAMQSFMEELAREIGTQVTEALADHARRADATVGELRAEIRRLEKRLDRAPALRGGRPARDVRRCKVEGCFQPHVAKGYCKNHYQQTRYRDKKQAEARAAGKRYQTPKPGEKRPGRKPKVPLPT